MKKLIPWKLNFKNLEDALNNQKKRAILFGISSAILLLFSAGLSFLYFKNKATTEKDEISQAINLDLPVVLDASQIDEEDKNTLNILLLGYGGAGHQGGMLSDVIQIIHFDFPAKKISFISIPRDLEVPLSDGARRKINSVFNYGLSGAEPFQNAGQISKQAIGQLTGLKLKYFIAIDFVGFKRLVGSTLGSIEVEVSRTLDDSWYPIEGKQLDPCGYSADEIATMTNTLSGFELESQFECRYEHLYFEPGIHQMEGSDALAYVRSRHSSSDFDRSRRQVEVLTGIRQKLFDLNALANIPHFFTQINQHVKTDLDLETLEYLAPLLVNTKDFEVKTINLSTENVLTSTKNNNGFVLIPKAGSNDWSAIQSFIQNSLTE